MNVVGERNCPRCNNKIIYYNKSTFYGARWSNTKCPKCVSELKSEMFSGSKNPAYGTKMPEAHKEKLRILRKSRITTEESRKKWSV